MNTRQLLTLSVLLGFGIAFLKFQYFSEPNTTPQLPTLDNATESGELHIVPEPDAVEILPAFMLPSTGVGLQPVTIAKRRTTLLFPNGEEVSVVLNAYWPPAPPSWFSYEATILSQIDKLRTQAEAGDMAAARTIYRVLSNCRRLLNSGVDLEGALNEIKSSNRSSTSKIALQEGVREGYHACEGVTEDHVRQGEHWLRLSVEGGDYLATRMLYQILDDRNDPEARMLLSKMWEEGHIGSLHSYAIKYRNEKNHISAYAYFLAYSTTRERVFELSVYPERHQISIQGNSNTLAVMSSYLSYEEQLQAEKLAVTIVEENKNCCRGFFNLSPP